MDSYFDAPLQNCSMLGNVSSHGSKDEESFMSSSKPEEQEKIELKRSPLPKFKKKQLGQSCREFSKALGRKRATPIAMPNQLDNIQLDTIRLYNIADELAEFWHLQGNPYRKRPCDQHEEPDRELQFDEDVIYEKYLGGNSGSWSTEVTSNKENDSWFSSNGSSPTKATSNKENDS